MEFFFSKLTTITLNEVSKVVRAAEQEHEEIVLFEMLT